MTELGKLTVICSKHNTHTLMKDIYKENEGRAIFFDAERSSKEYINNKLNELNQKREERKERPILNKTDFDNFYLSKLVNCGFFEIVNGSIRFHPCGKVDATKYFTVDELTTDLLSICSLYLYIAYYVKKGDLLIIEEPEVHLFSEKQMIMAKLLVYLVNNGIDVCIFTNSADIIRHFNIMIIAETGNNYNKIKDMDVFDGCLLKSEDVKCYEIGEEIIKSDISKEEGIEVQLFDECIEKQNELLDKIEWS